MIDFDDHPRYTHHESLQTTLNHTNLTWTTNYATWYYFFSLFGRSLCLFGQYIVNLDKTNETFGQPLSLVKQYFVYLSLLFYLSPLLDLLPSSWSSPSSSTDEEGLSKWTKYCQNWGLLTAIWQAVRYGYDKLHWFKNGFDNNNNNPKPLCTTLISP